MTPPPRASAGAAAAEVTAADVARARIAVRDVVHHTPVLPSAALGAQLGADVVLKAENLQRSGSFKLRGALAKLAALGDGCAAGVVCGSAGNHARALALAARERGVVCEVFMPAGAPVAKVEGAQRLGAQVTLAGDDVDACIGFARARAADAGLSFVHPFDDPDVVAGQGTLGEELLEDLPALATVVVPVGGGGLVSGVALAVRSVRPAVRVVGVQVRRGVTTIADGIAIKHPGALTRALMATWVDEVVTVGEDDVAEAMVHLLESEKLVVEGAGAVGVAALLGGLVRPSAVGTTCVVLSGGNVDPGLLATVARRHETQAGRRLALFLRVPDRPGGLARLLVLVGETGANLVDVAHVREGVELHVRETAVQLVLETRGPEHAAHVRDAIAAAGYAATVVR